MKIKTLPLATLMLSISLLVYAIWWFINPDIFNKYIALTLTLAVGVCGLAVASKSLRDKEKPAGRDSN